MFYAYILRSGSTGAFYIGHTSDLDARLWKHNNGRSPYMRARGPWDIVYKESFATRGEAMKRERALKKIANRQVLEQIIHTQSGRAVPTPRDGSQGSLSRRACEGIGKPYTVHQSHTPLTRQSSRSMPCPFRLVIFDCDGVLVDSERLTNTVFCELLNQQGLSLTLPDMFEHFVGRTTAECMAKVEAMLGRPAPEDFLDCYRSRCKEVLTSGLKAVEGVREVVESLPIPYCVASSGETEKMQLTLGITGLLPFFEGRIFSVIAEGTRPKPNPDIFLRAAERMDVAPSECVVIEDTPTGVQGGAAAGMTVFGYAELMPAERLMAAGATHVFMRMSELPALLH